MICVDNLETGSLANIEHIREPSSSCISTSTSSSRTSSTSRSTSSSTSPRPASPIDYLRLPLHTLKVGSYGTHHTLGLAKAKRARFLIASTSEVYGDPQVHPQPETYWGHVNPIGPRGVYDEAKRYAEALTMAYHRQQGVDTAIVRIFNTYGPADAPARRPRDPDVPAPGACRAGRSPCSATAPRRARFCYVDDLIRGLIALAESGEHEPVNIGNPDEFTLLELGRDRHQRDRLELEIVYEALPVDDPKQRRPDIALARSCSAGSRRCRCARAWSARSSSPASSSARGRGAH